MADQPAKDHEKQPPGVGTGIGLIAFSVYLFAGAITAVRAEKWPWFMPPQFDFFALMFSIFGERSGAYGGAAVLVVFGLLLGSLGVMLVVKGDRAA